MFRRPLLPFAVQSIVLTPLLLAPEPEEWLGGYFVAAPFLIIGMTLLNLPVVDSAFQKFRLPMSTRRNHALEHATVLILEASKKGRVRGLAAENGFRLYGKVTEPQIREAFEEVCRTIRAGRPLVCITPRCGSNIVTALAVATGLLLLLTIASLILDLPLAVRTGGWVSAVVVFVGLRRRLGNTLQRRCFIATDFVDVSLKGIRREPSRLAWRVPVHFVKTEVRLAIRSSR